MIQKTEEKPKRGTSEIQQEYQGLAFRAGNLQYEIVQKQSDLKLLNDTMRELSFEFVKVQAEEVKEAKLRADVAAELRATAEEIKNIINPESNVVELKEQVDAQA